MLKISVGNDTELMSRSEGLEVLRNLNVFNQTMLEPLQQDKRKKSQTLAQRCEKSIAEINRYIELVEKSDDEFVSLPHRWKVTSGFVNKPSS
jgi:hypothetical protein